MDEQQHNALELPKGLYEPVLRQPMELDFLLGQELSLCFHDLDGSHVFKTCYGDICKAVNALRDYARLLEMACEQWDLTGFHRALYEYHAEKMREIAGKFQAGIGYDCIEDVKIDGIVVSSTYIRQLISQGDMEGAAKFLGHPYTVSGIVEHGRRVGTSVLQVPTVNLRLPTEMAMPPYGVYATRVLVDGQSYIAATNIGVKPTFLDGGAPTIEPHLLDFAGDLYGKMIHVELHKFLRPEMQFESVEALKTAIEENVQQTREFFKEK